MANQLVTISTEETSNDKDLFRTLSNVLILAFVVVNMFFIINASTSFFASAPSDVQSEVN